MQDALDAARQSLSPGKEENTMPEPNERTCTACHETLPLEYFYFNTSTNKHDTKCKTCRREVQKKQKAQAKQAKKAKPVRVAATPAQSALPSEPPGLSDFLHRAETQIVISFDRHPELYQQLVSAAEADFRSPAQQILYWVSLWSKKHGGE